MKVPPRGIFIVTEQLGHSDEATCEENKLTEDEGSFNGEALQSPFPQFRYVCCKLASPSFGLHTGRAFWLFL